MLLHARLTDSEVCLVSQLRLLGCLVSFLLYCQKACLTINRRRSLLLEFVETKACADHLRSIAISVVGNKNCSPVDAWNL